MKMTKSNYVILLFLALLFAAPGLMAYLYYHNPQWLTANTANKGELLNPPQFIKLDNKAKWRLILWYPRHCEIACLQEVDKLARVRLALGRRFYEVDQWLVLGEESSQTLTRTLHEQDIHFLRLSRGAIFPDKPRIFIANPKGYLVLAYAETIKPKDIYHDINWLLKKGSSA